MLNASGHVSVSVPSLARLFYDQPNIPLLRWVRQNYSVIATRMFAFCVFVYFVRRVFTCVEQKLMGLFYLGGPPRLRKTTLLCICIHSFRCYIFAGIFCINIYLFNYISYYASLANHFSKLFSSRMVVLGVWTLTRPHPGSIPGTLSDHNKNLGLLI